ncbi:hypothetical protein Sango_2353600 [Sesamum angolense]|uniref:TLDc domain-containing protein n=1 Tax=Sesamum angolense TaxID=2727404 RepID=A0AAE2BJA5_9LAMI|nr:hypothetical protein Sango_2353600 [Sesamum angolense]
MGQSSSTEQQLSPELRQVQSLAASTGALPSLEKAFSLLSDPQTKSIPIHSLQKCFDLAFESLESERGPVFKEFPCCLVTWAGLPVDVKFELYDDDCKISGSFSPRDIFMLLWICWIFSWDSRISRSNTLKKKGECRLPDVSHLVLSAIESSAENGHELDYWDSVVTELDFQLPAAKIHLWALKTVPHLADCFQQFLHARLCCLTTPEDKSEPSCSSSHESSSSAISETTLLTRGTAWAISLTLRGPIYEEMSKACFASEVDEINENLLYRSSVHGKGLNRFWSNIEGYNGPLLLLIAACEEENKTRRWIIGALTQQGFENKELFYGTSGNLYALSPVFHALLSSGREKNFVYSHLHPTGRVYEAHPKPVGVAFGGSIGNERIFMDVDFGRVTIRHHAADKTYQHGALFPNQGFLPVEAAVLEVEAWGLGGRTAREIQASYKKREELFTEQRRKVDLKTFANWEDSPEKMMMDMMSNPNTVRREDR